jgi:hypothetical protein
MKDILNSFNDALVIINLALSTTLIVVLLIYVFIKHIL